MKKYRDIILAIGAILLYMYGVIFIYYFLQKINGNEYFLLIGTYAIVLGILVFVFRKKIFEDIGNINKKMLLTGLKYWFIGFVFMALANNLLNTIFGTIAENEASNRELLGELFIPSLIIMTIIGPICEEICFRLSLKNVTNNKYIFLILSAVLFGYVHVIGSNIAFIISYGILGFYFAYMYLETKNIFTSIIFHMLHNSIAILLIIITGGI